MFRSALGKQRNLSAGCLSANSIGLMPTRRLRDAALLPIFSPHGFRVLLVTDLVSQPVPLEDVQYLAGHANPRIIRRLCPPACRGFTQYRGEAVPCELSLPDPVRLQPKAREIILQQPFGFRFSSVLEYLRIISRNFQRVIDASYCITGT